MGSCQTRGTPVRLPGLRRIGVRSKRTGLSLTMLQSNQRSEFAPFLFLYFVESEHRTAQGEITFVDELIR